MVAILALLAVATLWGSSHRLLAPGLEVQSWSETAKPSESAAPSTIAGVATVAFDQLNAAFDLRLRVTGSVNALRLLSHSSDHLERLTILHLALPPPV